MSEQGPPDIPMARWPSVSALPGAAQALDGLAGTRRFRLAIATNASLSRKPDIWAALERVGLRNYFEEVFCFTELGFKKNQVEFWQIVSRQLRVPLPSIAMVGDSLEHDASAPRRFGVQAFWLAPLGSVPAQVTSVPAVHSLLEFAAWARSQSS